MLFRSDEKECTSYADCCYGEFCWFLHATDEEKGIGKCYSVKSFTIDSGTEGANGEVWIRPAQTMNWWSAQDWCLAQNLEPATRENIGCDGVAYDRWCTETIAQNLPANSNLAYWLEDSGNNRGAYYIPTSEPGHIFGARRGMNDYARPLCLRR